MPAKKCLIGDCDGYCALMEYRQSLPCFYELVLKPSRADSFRHAVHPIATISTEGEGNLYCLAIVKNGDINIIGLKCLDLVKYYIAYSQCLSEILSPFMYVSALLEFLSYGLV
ncbi:hypothetical protein RHSIM_Rhsim02G0125800 [Rhododendron simsii]|uniref:Uncharacterized protein n=1 Tax=Rhododendron simsii TaxID=118357 RepID=A0A834HE97_RHOSS|nr:hypothetical protein RHSIM_Rhsim02G0125800 [Rhododendron simsii]